MVSNNKALYKLRKKFEEPVITKGGVVIGYRNSLERDCGEELDALIRDLEVLEILKKYLGIYTLKVGIRIVFDKFDEITEKDFEKVKERLENDKN